ncbi:MAG: lipoate--protein ligase family protein [Planctomycetes bacterium]|nr:lipoate--protein ligase family protein [Planctomycetota bacterium]
MCRLLIDPPAEGAWNMAVDETLLEAAESRGEWSLRFYQWSEPTLSLGYFQSSGELADRWQQTAVVRRSSGGGAIMHDAELTYSLAAPPTALLAREPLRLYRSVHLGVIACLGQYGIDAQLCQVPSAGSTKDQPLLCFERRSAGDLLVGEAKICGSAQRRRRGAVLQHGSIVLGTSPSAPEIAGLDEIAAVRIDPLELADALAVELSSRLNLGLENRGLSADEADRAEFIASETYRSTAWLRRR